MSFGEGLEDGLDLVGGFGNVVFRAVGVLDAEEVDLALLLLRERVEGEEVEFSKVTGGNGVDADADVASVEALSVEVQELQ